MWSLRRTADTARKRGCFCSLRNGLASGIPRLGDSPKHLSNLPRPRDIKTCPRCAKGLGFPRPHATVASDRFGYQKNPQKNPSGANLKEPTEEARTVAVRTSVVSLIRQCNMARS